MILAVLAVVTAIPCSAAVLNVPAEHPDIESALALAVPGDEVVVAAGHYPEHDLILPSGIVLRGATGDPADVVIDGERAGRCIYGANLDTATRLEALTLSNGLPALGTTPHNSWGAGLMVDEGELTISNCVFTGNETAIGGGAFIIGTGAPVIVDCIFDGNSASESAGLLLHGTCDPLVKNCIFRNGDRVTYGGGLTWTGAGHLLLEDCTVEDNTVIESGGGVEILGSAAVATLRNCVIRHNVSGYGAGGLSVGNHGRVVLEQCQITENSADNYAGGIGLGTGTYLEADDSSILNNTSPTGADCQVGSSATATLTCCDIDLEAWAILGAFSQNNDDCVVAAEESTWSEVKRLYR